MPWDAERAHLPLADEPSTDVLAGLEVQAPSALVAHRGFILSFSEVPTAVIRAASTSRRVSNSSNGSNLTSSHNASGNGSDVSCVPLLQVSYLRPGQSRWRHAPAPQLVALAPDDSRTGTPETHGTLLAEFDVGGGIPGDGETSNQMNGTAYTTAASCCARHPAYCVPRWWHTMRRFDTSARLLGNPAGATASIAGEAARISIDRFDDRRSEDSSGSETEDPASSGLGSNRSDVWGGIQALLQAPSALWDPLGRLPDADSEQTAHLALFYHVSFRFRHAAAQCYHFLRYRLVHYCPCCHNFAISMGSLEVKIGHAWFASNHSSALVPSALVPARNSSGSGSATRDVNASWGSCIGRLTARWAGVDRGCVPQLVDWQDGGAPLLCDFPHRSAASTLTSVPIL